MKTVQLSTIWYMRCVYWIWFGSSICHFNNIYKPHSAQIAKSQIIGVALFKGSKEVVHPKIFNVNIHIRVQYIQGLQKNITSLGGGGGAQGS